MITFDKRSIRMWSRLGTCGTFGMAMDALAAEDETLSVMTADLCFYSGLERFRRNYEEKYYNLGIAEQNMIGVAAGMASEGYNVFATTYASFAATRCCDQVKVNMAYMRLPVKLVGLTAGLSVGILGATHMSYEDVAVMRAMPNITILSPADCTETVKAVMAAAKHDGPVYLRLTGGMNAPIVYNEDYVYEVGKAITLKEGTDVAIVATGSMVYPSCKAAELLAEDGVSCGVLDMHTIKPLDEEALEEAAKTYRMIVTVEEHSKIGGLGSAVTEYFADRNDLPVKIIGLPDAYSHAANYEYLLEKNGLTAEGLYKKVKGFVEEREIGC